MQNPLYDCAVLWKLPGEFSVELKEGWEGGVVENKMMFKLHSFLMSDQIFPEFLKYLEQFSNYFVAADSFSSKELSLSGLACKTG